MKNDRLFRLLYLLLEHGTMTAPALSQALEVSTRTVYRDVEVLSASGVPVYTISGKGGGISLMPGYTFDKRLLSKDEQSQLIFALQSLQASDQNMTALLDKLGAAFQNSCGNWIEVDFSRWGAHQTDTALFQRLKDAILSRQVLLLTYCGASGETTQRQIHPLKLIYKDRHWYLQAFCLKAEDFRLFKMSRILSLSPTGESFSADYDGELPPIEPETPPSAATPVRLRFSDRLAYRVYEEFDRSSVFRQSDGSLVVQASLPSDSWLVSYLLSFGTGVEILEPVLLRQALAEYAEKISRHHNT